MPFLALKAAEGVGVAGSRRALEAAGEGERTRGWEGNYLLEGSDFVTALQCGLAWFLLTLSYLITI
jgi:hypothetical protein